MGGIGIVFDSKAQFQAMLEESIPGFERAKKTVKFLECMPIKTK